jgi:hypothetical protein
MHTIFIASEVSTVGPGRISLAVNLIWHICIDHSINWGHLIFERSRRTFRFIVISFAVTQPCLDGLIMFIIMLNNVYHMTFFEKKNYAQDKESSWELAVTRLVSCALYFPNTAIYFIISKGKKSFILCQCSVKLEKCPPWVTIVWHM